MSEWNPYYLNRKIKYTSENVAVIVPAEEISIVPLSCKYCGFLFRSLRDEESYRKYECCDNCENELYDFLIKNINPTQEQINSNISKRNKPNVHLEK